MDRLTRQLSGLLAEIEAELRRLELWEGVSPAAQNLMSAQPFCYDTLEFPQWLQWLFLARMKALVDAGGPYPARSGIHAYAEEWAAHAAVESTHLLVLIKRVDALIEAPRPSAQA
ncbi:MAG: YqcC family protein [Pseudomonadota bacterium]